MGKKRKMFKIGERKAKALEELNRRKKAKKYSDFLPVEAGEIIKANHVTLVKQYPKPLIPKYSGKRGLLFNEDCSLLQYFMLMRQYIKIKYDIDLQLLETLLYLYPTNYFTANDFHDMPLQFKYGRMRTMVEWGYIVLVSEGQGKGEVSLYTLATKYKKIIREFYALLSGEKTIPKEEIEIHSKRSKTTIEQKRLALLKKLSGLPVPEGKKKMFE